MDIKDLMIFGAFSEAMKEEEEEAYSDSKEEILLEWRAYASKCYDIDPDNEIYGNIEEFEEAVEERRQELIDEYEDLYPELDRTEIEDIVYLNDDRFFAEMDLEFIYEEILEEQE